MAEGTAAGNAEYAEVMRELVESVTVMPGEELGQVVINIKGRLNALLGEEAFPNRRKGWGGGRMNGSGGPSHTIPPRLMYRLLATG
jgi:site-specific DNA recombinase